MNWGVLSPNSSCAQNPHNEPKESLVSPFVLAFKEIFPLEVMPKVDEKRGKKKIYL